MVGFCAGPPVEYGRGLYGQRVRGSVDQYKMVQRTGGRRFLFGLCVDCDRR